MKGLSPRHAGLRNTRAGRMTATLAVATSTALAWTSNAEAQSTITDDAAHPNYAVELEPHGNLGLFLPPGDGDGFGLGAGLRATIPVAQRGFIDGVNDSVGVGFGLDWVYYMGTGPSAGSCAEYVGNGNDRICVRVAGAGGASHYFYLPLAMQWNFFLTPQWSVFGEPGFTVALQQFDAGGSLGVSFAPIFQAGARYHFTESVALTLRTGYPLTSIGVSFLF